MTEYSPSDPGYRESISLKLPLREVLRHDDGSSFGRTIYLYWKEERRPRWIDFEIFEAIGHEGPPGGQERPIYYATDRRELFGRDGVTADLSRAVWTTCGFVKLDGCTQVYFPEGPLHYDDLASLRGLFGSICRAQERCYEIMDDDRALDGEIHG
jgi:hypothetical protein